jgi:hypothetical protein
MTGMTQLDRATITNQQHHEIKNENQEVAMQRQAGRYEAEERS